MGTLDDAIREHLELKRKHGADDEEIAELEDSAFGPPERPGTEGVPGEAEPVAEMAAEPPAAETTLMPAEGTAEPAPPPVQPEPEPHAEPEAAAEDAVSPAEQARQDYSQLEDTIPHEAVPRPEPVQSTEEQDALEISLFESDDAEEDFDIGDVDLDLADGETAPSAQSAEPEAQPEPEPEPESGPAEDSVREHAIFDAEAVEPGQSPGGEPEVGEPEELPAAEAVIDPDPTGESFVADPDPEDSDEVEAVAPAPMVDPDPTEEGHDVLEDTPEFLKDAPESDEMWFEQDKPQDFDFDD